MTKYIALCLAALFAVPALASERHSLEAGGRSRSYHVYRPLELSRTRLVPLVVMLHGGFGSGSQAEHAYGWDAAADRGGFVVAYPDGIGRSWNAGGTCCGPALRDHVDDVGFLDAMIDAVARGEAVDRSRIYLTGMSNGGAMTYRYACEGHIRLAAIGPVATSFTYSGCHAPHPVAVMAIHGMQDRTVPFAGGAGRRGPDLVWQPVQASLDVFRDAANCGAPVLAQSGVVATATAACELGREVVLITVADGGHQWPGSRAETGLIPRLLRLDEPSQAFDATARLWSFFGRYTSGND
jgi:polyhydroxybutyrate depolymerase